MCLSIVICGRVGLGVRFVCCVCGTVDHMTCNTFFCVELLLNGGDSDPACDVKLGVGWVSCITYCLLIAVRGCLHYAGVGLAIGSFVRIRNWRRVGFWGPYTQHRYVVGNFQVFCDFCKIACFGFCGGVDGWLASFLVGVWWPGCYNSSPCWRSSPIFACCCSWVKG